MVASEAADLGQVLATAHKGHHAQSQNRIHRKTHPARALRGSSIREKASSKLLTAENAVCSSDSCPAGIVAMVASVSLGPESPLLEWEMSRRHPRSHLYPINRSPMRLWNCPAHLSLLQPISGLGCIGHWGLESRFRDCVPCPAVLLRLPWTPSGMPWRGSRCRSECVRVSTSF